MGRCCAAAAADYCNASVVNFLRGISELIGRHLINSFAIEQFGFTGVRLGEDNAPSDLRP